jgi:hypothetical protein
VVGEAAGDEDGKLPEEGLQSVRKLLRLVNGERRGGVPQEFPLVPSSTNP